MRTKQHKLILTILIIYTALIVYFLFFGVGRLGAAITVHEYRFNLIPNLIQLRFPTLSDFTHFRFFDLGNFAGFIPFGLLIPMLYRWKFFRFISFFLLSILILETVQMLTYLGSFDINDVIVNSLGAVVGFCAYKIGFRFKSTRKKLVVTVMTVVILSIGVIGFSELLNKAFTKKEGPIIALNELESDLNMPMDKSLQSFEIGHEKVEPKINLYGSEGDNVEIFTYEFEGKDIVLSLNYGIPDSASNYSGEVIVSVDGQEIGTRSMDKEYRDIVSSEFNIDKVNKLTITIKGNVKLWDVTFKEMKYSWN